MEPPVEKSHILIVDDDPKVRLLLRRCFEPDGFEVTEAGSAAETIACLSESSVDLVSLDLNLGADDGLALARQIKEFGDIPIVMITGKGDVIDKVVGLELGADDYISKPFHVREVLARVRSVIRRSQPSGKSETGAISAAEQEDESAKRYKFEGWVADFNKLEVVDPNGEPVSLSTGELKFLEVFLSHPARVLNRDQLMDYTKGNDWFPNDRSIDNQIARLRKKIEPDPKEPRFIRTVRGSGYSFTAEVQKI